MDDGPFRVTSVAWSDAAEDMRRIRESVFIREQGVPPHLEWDGLDPDSLHVLAVERGGQPIGTGRLTRSGKIGRMAVLSGWRNRGVGGVLLETLLDLARKRGFSRVSLDAQVTAIGFYERHGFQATGDVFIDAGILHRKMILDLPG